MADPIWHCRHQPGLGLAGRGARLEQGGSAIDAAIAANAVLNVTEPTSNGMGGDLFAIYWEAKTGKLYGLNASGWRRKLSASSIEIERIAEKMPEEGIDSVTVPGVVDGWAKLHKRFGRLPWRDLFQPAIYYAEHGFPVSEIIHDGGQGIAKASGLTLKARASSCPAARLPRRARSSAIPTLHVHSGSLPIRANPRFIKATPPKQSSKHHPSWAAR